MNSSGDIWILVRRITNKCVPQSPSAQFLLNEVKRAVKSNDPFETYSWNHYLDVFLLEMFWSCNPFKVMGLLLVLSPQSALSAERSSSSVPLVSWHFRMKLLWMSRLKDCYLALHISLNTDHLKDYIVSRNCEEERGEEELVNFQTMSSTRDSYDVLSDSLWQGKLLFIPLQLMENVKKGKRCEANALCQHFCILLGMCIESGSEKKIQINDCLCKEYNQYIWQN